MAEIFRPLKITDAVLTSSNVAEPATTTNPDPPAYNAATTYAVNDECSSFTTHRRYLSKVGSNTGHDPTADTFSAYWQDIGPTNKWAMFDDAGVTQTTHADEVVVTLTLDDFADSLCVINADAISVRVQVAGTAYDRTENMVSRRVADWYDFYFEPFRRKRDVVFTGLPLLANAVITVTASYPGQTAGIGYCRPAMRKFIGTAKPNARVRLKDYSRVETDDFGQTVFTPLPYAKAFSCTVQFERAFLDEFIELMAQYRATPIVWRLSEVFTSTLLCGFFTNAEASASPEPINEGQIDVQGTI